MHRTPDVLVRALLSLNSPLSTPWVRLACVASLYVCELVLRRSVSVGHGMACCLPSCSLHAAKPAASSTAAKEGTQRGVRIMCAWLLVRTSRVGLSALQTSVRSWICS